MATLIPISQPTSNVEAAYEDMFKEITRKLYGEEAGNNNNNNNGMQSMGNNQQQQQHVSQVPTSAQSESHGNERSFTNLATTIDYNHQPSVNTSSGNTSSNDNERSDELTSAAYGLAALMQNGFASTATNLLNTQQLIKTINTVEVQQNTSGSSNGNSEQQRWSNDNNSQWTQGVPGTGGKSFSGIQKPIKKNRDHINIELFNSASTITPSSTSSSNGTPTTQPINKKSKISAPLGQVPNITTNTSNNINTSNSQITVPATKRYVCSHCPYSTDRRDLYTRHENIHKDEKPFQCYACLKQFNRADHVKKHFLRMHREMVYDLHKTRRNIVSTNATSNNVQQQNQQQNTVQQTPIVTAQIDQKPNIFTLHSENGAQALVESFVAAQQQQQQQQQQASQQVQPQRHTSSLVSISETIESVATNAHNVLVIKPEKNTVVENSSIQIAPSDEKNNSLKTIKKEKRFTCCYCSWSGADKWGLKRHLNTHTKPFVCLLCDYKAARSERLTTHVLKVHNKRACNKCSFLADSQEEYQNHITEAHIATNNNNSANNIFSNDIQTATTTNNSSNTTTIPLQEIIVNPSSMVGWRISANGSLIPPEGGLLTTPNYKRGAERLFQYLEADGSDPEDYARQLKMEAISRNTASVAQDFHNAGGVDLRIQQKKHSNIINNNQINLPLKKINKEAASLQNHLNNNNNEVISENDQLKAMSNFLSNFQLREKVNNDVEVMSPPAINHSQQQPKQIPTNKGHRLQDKENSIFNKMEIDFLQNYVKDIISKYYNYNYKTHELQTTLRSNQPQQPHQKNETEEYIEYLKNKTDITLTVTTVVKKPPNKDLVIPQASIVPIVNAIDLSCAESKSRNRKQCKPRKIETPSELLMLALKAKYTKISIAAGRKKCLRCGLLLSRSRYAFHCATKHSQLALVNHSFKCLKCEMNFDRKYSLKIHQQTMHSSE
ncbi:hypothetical protein ACFFRR_009560 [Megaselia abdita]